MACEPGQVVGLISPSGAGKSTLIRCINRLVEPSSGQVFLGDTELTGLGRGALRRSRRRIGMIFQDYALVERLTVMENVLSARLGYVDFLLSFFRPYTHDAFSTAYEPFDRAWHSVHVRHASDPLAPGPRTTL